MTHPYFVRCIKPNMSLAPDDFNGALVLRQFNCTGTTECVKLMQVGFPSRAPYEDLRSRFKSSLPAEFGTMPSARFVGLLLVACGGKEGDYQLGQDMVFFKASKGGMLAELMLIPKDEIASRIVEQSTKDVGLLDKELRDVLVQYIEQRKEERAAALKKVEAAFLATVKLVQWMHWGEQRLKAKNAAAVKVQARRRAALARRRVEGIRRAKKAAEEAEAARKAAAAAATAAAKKEAEEAQRKAGGGGGGDQEGGGGGGGGAEGGGSEGGGGGRGGGRQRRRRRRRPRRRRSRRWGACRRQISSATAACRA